MAKVTRLTLDSGGGLDRRRVHLREVCEDVDAPLEAVGQDLRAARQRKGEDLARISQVLKIRKDHLQALEESNFDALPGRAYTIGFVRAYAEYLGLDGALFVERLKTEIAGRSEAREGAVQVTSPRERRLPPGGIVLAALLLIALIYGAYYLFVAVNRMTAQPVTPVPARLAEQAGLSAPAPPPSTPTRSTDTAPATTPGASEGGTAITAPSTTGSPPESGQGTGAAPAAAPVTAPAAAQASATQSANSAAAVPQGRKFGAQNAGSRITIVAHRPTHILVQGRNKLLLQDRQLQPGDSYLVPNMVGVTVSTSDSGALELILDGASMGYAGKDGVASEGLSLNPQDIVDRQAHG